MSDWAQFNRVWPPGYRIEGDDLPDAPTDALRYRDRQLHPTACAVGLRLGCAQGHTRRGIVVYRGREQLRTVCRQRQIPQSRPFSKQIPQFRLHNHTYQALIRSPRHNTPPHIRDHWQFNRVYRRLQCPGYLQHSFASIAPLSGHLHR